MTTDQELKQVYRRHLPSPDGTQTSERWCVNCNEVWPCDAARMLQLYDDAISRKETP